MKRKVYLFWARCVLVLIITIFYSLKIYSYTPGVPDNTYSSYTGMVSTSHPLASLIGAQILEKGGNAIDAAAAIQFALNVVEPMMSGIGGGGFLMIYLNNEKAIKIIDYREKAPGQANPNLFLKKDGTPMEFDDAVYSGKSVGVPGTLMGFLKALELYGTMKLKDLIDPAIALAENGHKVNGPLAESIKEGLSKFNDEAMGTFAPNGKPLPEGALLVQSDLAKTFKLIRDFGPSVFYGDNENLKKYKIRGHVGEIGKEIVNVARLRGGIISVKDLENYNVAFRKPVQDYYHSFKIVTMPPPSSGGLTLLQMLKILEGFNIRDMGPLTADSMHLMLEIMHLGYADRNKYLADSDFVKIPFTGYLHPDYIKERRNLVDMTNASPNILPGDPWKYEKLKITENYKTIYNNMTGQTTHFTVLDKWGNFVSCTTTIESVFGSGIMVPHYGFMLNNEMTDFDLVPGGVNQVEANKRPRSSMTPSIIFKDEKPFLSVGSPGGSTIIATVFEVIVNILDFAMSVQEAIDTPRFMSASYPNVDWEVGIPESVKAELINRGHKFSDQPKVQGSVQSIVIDLDTGRIYGGADKRREGTVIGVQ